MAGALTLFWALIGSFKCQSASAARWHRLISTSHVISFLFRLSAFYDYRCLKTPFASNMDNDILLKVYHMVKDCVGCNCVLWNCDGYTLTYILCYRIIFGCVNVRVSKVFEFSRTAQTRSHPYKLYRRETCNNVRASYFAVRVINVWNSLPADSVDFFLLCGIQANSPTD